MKIRTFLPTLIVSAILLSFGLTACAAIPGAASIPLEGTFWVLQSYSNQQGGEQTVIADTEINAKFQNGSVSGTDSCNQYSAPYQVSGDKITIQQGISTLMACPEPIMDQAQGFMAALTSVSSFKITGSTLELIDASGNTVLTFSAGESGLSGTSWLATGYNNGKQAVVSVLDGSEITAAFGEDGQLTGSAGCNNYNASYTVDGDSIHVGPAASTRKLCSSPVGVMEQEYAYLSAIQQAASYERTGSELTLRDAEGAMLAVYQSR